MDVKSLFSNIDQEKLQLLKGIGTPLLVLAALGMVVMPMPPFLLDTLFFDLDCCIVVVETTIHMSITRR